MDEARPPPDAGAEPAPRLIRAALWLWLGLFLAPACTLPPYTAAGKHCDDRVPCPAGLACRDDGSGQRTCQPGAGGGPGATAFEVGSFLKADGVTTQAVPHGLGQPPRALLVWTVGLGGEQATQESRFVLGFTDGERSRSAGVYEGSSGGETVSVRSYSPALLGVPGGATGSPLAVAELLGWDAQSFTLRWSTNGGPPFQVHYAALAGDALQARLVEWSTPAASGAHAVSGVGFQPEVVLHLHAGGAIAGAEDAPHGAWGFGVQAAQGGQWAVARVRTDGLASGYWNARFYDPAASYLDLEVPTGDGYAVRQSGRAGSLDPDGFSLVFSNALPGSGPVASLALRGVAAHAGTFSRSAEAASQTVDTPGVRPELLLLSSAVMPQPDEPLWDVLTAFGAATPAASAAAAVRLQVGTLNMTTFQRHPGAQPPRADLAGDLPHAAGEQHEPAREQRDPRPPRRGARKPVVRGAAHAHAPCRRGRLCREGAPAGGVRKVPE